MTPRDRLQYERTARIWTEAERAAASDKIARHFERINAERQPGRGSWALAVIMVALVVLIIIASDAPAKVAATVLEAELRGKGGW